MESTLQGETVAPVSDREEWEGTTARLARIVQAMVGWIFWDPDAISRYATLGVPGGLGYLATRAAPIAAAGDDAVVAVLYAWADEPVRTSMRIARQETTFGALWSARDRAIREGLAVHAPSATIDLAEIRDDLWSAVMACEPNGRPLFAACLNMPMPTDPALSAWHALNCLREWRGDTHNAVLIAAGLSPVEALILDSAWADYPPDWMARSRMWGESAITTAMHRLEERGFAESGRVLADGIDFRIEIEARTDELTIDPWVGIGTQRTDQIERTLRPLSASLLDRVDQTAGPRYLSAARLHDRAHS
jgi:hypothetical protein